jgi:hypothetical protein
VPIHKWAFSKPLRRNAYHHFALDALLKRVSIVIRRQIAMSLS